MVLYLCLLGSLKGLICSLFLVYLNVTLSLAMIKIYSSAKKNVSKCVLKQQHRCWRRCRKILCIFLFLWSAPWFCCWVNQQHTEFIKIFLESSLKNANMFIRKGIIKIERIIINSNLFSILHSCICFGMISSIKSF